MRPVVSGSAVLREQPKFGRKVAGQPSLRCRVVAAVQRTRASARQRCDVDGGRRSPLLTTGPSGGDADPSVKFISSAAGSGNDMTYFMRLGVDPEAAPTATSTAVTHYAELRSQVVPAESLHAGYRR